eukprot:359899-Chlamydomonas_euryale.AAC.2
MLKSSGAHQAAHGRWGKSEKGVDGACSRREQWAEGMHQHASCIARLNASVTSLGMCARAARGGAADAWQREEE